MRTIKQTKMTKFKQKGRIDVKGKSILESKTIEEIWPTIPQKFRDRWEEVYTTFLYWKNSYKKARKRINALRKHARINEDFLARYDVAKVDLIDKKRRLDAQRASLNRLSLKLFTNVPVELCDREAKASVQEKRVLEPFTVVLDREQVEHLAEHLKKCLSNWPNGVNRVGIEFDENVAYHTHAVSESADDRKKTFVTSKERN